MIGSGGKSEKCRRLMPCASSGATGLRVVTVSGSGANSGSAAGGPSFPWKYWRYALIVLPLVLYIANRLFLKKRAA